MYKAIFHLSSRTAYPECASEASKAPCKRDEVPTERERGLYVEGQGSLTRGTRVSNERGEGLYLEGRGSLTRGTRSLPRGARSLPRGSKSLTIEAGTDGAGDWTFGSTATRRHTRAEARPTIQPRALRGLGVNPDLRPRRRPLQGRAIEVIATYSGGGFVAAAIQGSRTTPRQAQGWIARRASAPHIRSALRSNRQPTTREALRHRRPQLRQRRRQLLGMRRRHILQLPRQH